MSELFGESLKVADWVPQYKLTSFVETGCYVGTALEYAQSLGLKLNSCDINDDYVKDCLQKFPEANILVGESTTCLKEILPTLTERTLFWLDAHIPNKYGRPWLFTDENYWPLLEEMFMIKKLKANYQFDLIICDDMRNINASDNPMFDGTLPPEAVPGVGHQIQEYFDVFADTHDIQFIQTGTGMLVAFPRMDKSNV